MKMTSLESFSDRRNVDTFHVLEANIVEMRKIQNQDMQVEFNDDVNNDTTNIDIIESEENVAKTIVDYDENIKNILKRTTRIYLMWKINYYMEGLKKKNM